MARTCQKLISALVGGLDPLSGGRKKTFAVVVVVLYRSSISRLGILTLSFDLVFGLGF